MPTDEEMQRAIDAAVSAADKRATERTRIALALENVTDSLAAVVEGQADQLAESNKVQVALGRIDTRLTGIDARQGTADKKISDLEKGEKTRGIIAGGGGGAVSGAAIWAILKGVFGG